MIMSKYFTPITELPGDSGKSESAAGMVRYKRSTSDNNKFSKSLSLDAKFVSPKKMFPESTKQSVPNSGKFLKRGTSLSKTLSPFETWLIEEGKKLVAGTKSTIDFTLEALEKNIPHEEIDKLIHEAYFDTSGTPIGNKINEEMKTTSSILTRDAKQKQAALDAVDKAKKEGLAYYDPSGVMPSSLRDAFKQFANEFETINPFNPSIEGAKAKLDANGLALAGAMGLKPEALPRIHEGMKDALNANSELLHPYPEGVPIAMNHPYYRDYKDTFENMTRINDYSQRHPYGTEPLKQATKRILIDPLVIGTLGGLGYGGYQLYNHLKQNNDPLNQNNSLDSNSNYTPPVDNTIKPITTPIPKSNDPFDNMGGPIPTPHAYKPNNQNKKARLQKGGGRFAKDTPPIIKSWEEAWPWIREHLITVLGYTENTADAVINGMMKDKEDKKLTFHEIQDSIDNMHALAESRKAKLNPPLTTLAPVVDKESEKKRKQILYMFDLTSDPKMPQTVKNGFISQINDASALELDKLYTDFKAMTPALAGLRRSGENTLNTLNSIFDKAKNVNWLGGLDEAQRLVDTARQKNIPATIIDAVGNVIPNPYYTKPYVPSKIIDPRAKGLERIAQTYADVQTNPNRKWTKNALNIGLPVGLATGLGVAAYNHYTQPDPPPPPEPAWGQNNGLTPRDDKGNYVLPKVNNALSNATNGAAIAAQTNASRIPADRASTSASTSPELFNLNPKLNNILNEMGIKQSELNPKMLRYVNNQLDAESQDNPMATRRINDWKDFSLLNPDQLKSAIKAIKTIPIDANTQDYIEGQKDWLNQGVAMRANENKTKNDALTANWGRDMITGDEPDILGRTYNNGIMPNLLNAVSFGLIPKAKYDAPKYLTYPKITSTKDVPFAAAPKTTQKRASSVKKADNPWSRDKFYNTTPRKMKTPDYVTSTTNTRFANLSDKEKGRMAATQAFQEAKKKYNDTSDIVQHTIQRAGEIASDIGLGTIGLAGALTGSGISGFNDLKRKAKSSKDFMSGVADVYEEKVGTNQDEKAKKQKMSESVRNKFESGMKSVPSDTINFANSMIEQSKPVIHNVIEQSKPIIRNAINQSKPVIRNMINQSQSELGHLADSASHVSQDVINGISNWMQSNSSKGKTTKRYVEKNMHFQKSMTTATPISQNTLEIQKHRNKYIDGK
jgi:hypothetical protein